MQRVLTGFAIVVLLALGLRAAHADFMIASAIVEFTADGPHQQDIELISRSKDNDYIETEISEIKHPGETDESRRIVTEPSQGDLLVTPDKTVLTGGGRKVLRFVLLKDPDAQEHIYRVAIRPVIKGLDSKAKIGLKILVGYEALVIIRPADPKPAYTVDRKGKTLTIRNTGNTNILFQNGKQCPQPDRCTVPQVVRVYAGQSAHVELASDAPVSYSIWDGDQTIEKQFE